MKTLPDSHITGKLVLPLLLFSVLLAGCTNPESPIPIPLPSTTIAFTAFTAPTDGTVGVPYSYSFCKPDLKSTSDQCGGIKETTNPTGGHPPYSFTLGSGTGFPPFGISLNMNGVLSGTPTAEGTRTFSVCAKDLDGNQECQTTTLTINPAPTSPAPTGCTEDADCNTGYCESGVCKARPQPQCTDSQCESNLCKNGKCVKCEVDEDCHDNNICFASKCVVNNIKVTIDDSSCTILTYYGPSDQAKKEGWRFAHTYSMRISGTMTGPEFIHFYLQDSPIVPSWDGSFSCGAWTTEPDYEKQSHSCRRPANSSETAQWSDIRPSFPGEYLPDDLNVAFDAKMSDGPGSEILAEQKLVVSCPAENR